MSLRGKKFQTVGMITCLGMSVVLVFAQPFQAIADSGPIECTVVGENLLVGYNPSVPCGVYRGPTIAINYAPPFSEEPGRCLGEAVDLDEDVGMIVFEVSGSYNGCPHEVGDVVTYFTSAFVTPESPIGAIAMVLVSMGGLGAYIWRSRK